MACCAARRQRSEFRDRVGQGVQTVRSNAGGGEDLVVAAIEHRVMDRGTLRIDSVGQLVKVGGGQCLSQMAVIVGAKILCKIVDL